MVQVKSSAPELSPTDVRMILVEGFRVSDTITRRLRLTNREFYLIDIIGKIDNQCLHGRLSCPGTCMFETWMTI
jgi:hypothetical protein